MCPVCIATAAVIAGSATGTGGLTAFFGRKFLKRGIAPEATSGAKENPDGNRHAGSEASPGRLA